MKKKKTKDVEMQVKSISERKGEAMKRSVIVSSERKTREVEWQAQGDVYDGFASELRSRYCNKCS